jgi:hypothetical protein
MSPESNSTATKAVEWVVEKLTVASTSGWFTEKLSALANSSPAYLSGGASAPAPTQGYSAPASAPSGVSKAELDAVRDAASRADSTAQALAGRVAKLEDQIRQLRKAQEELSSHLEEAVGPSGEGAHRAHWWSKK